MITAEESDVARFLTDHNNEASLDQISEDLDIAKYGPKSAYALLQSLRSKNVLARKGEMWMLMAPETAAKPTEVEEKAEVKT